MNTIAIALCVALVGLGLLFSMYRKSCDDTAAGAEKNRKLYRLALLVLAAATVVLGVYYVQDSMSAEEYLTEPFDRSGTVPTS